MKQVHMTLQGKGGIGKSLVASFLAQYHLEKNQSATCINTDPINATFARYKPFNTIHFDLVEQNEVDMARLDDLMAKIISEDSHFIIDNGVASYLPMCNYLVGFGAVEALAEAGKEVVLHIVISGGQAMLDTLENLNQLAAQMPKEVKLFVWLNEYEGQIEKQDGQTLKKFEDMLAYTNNKDRISGVIRIPQQYSLFSRDVKNMLNEFLTFEEAIEDPSFHVMSKQRLTRGRRNIFEQMDLKLLSVLSGKTNSSSKKGSEQMPVAV